MAPIETFIVEGILTFQLNTNSLLTDNVATFESLAEDFLRRHLTIKLALDYNSEISLSSYDVTVASQTLVPHEQPSSTTISAEPLHVRMLEGPAILFLVTTVTAIGTPAELAADFPFQTAISIILLDNSDEFYGSLYTSGAFDGMQPPEHEHVELNGSDDGINKPLVFGSSIAGILVMLLLAGALFAMRSRHERKVEKAEKVVSCIAPSAGWVDRELDEEMGCKLSDSGVGFHMTETLHAALPFRDEEGNDLSSLDDSLSQDNPETISHEGSDLDASFNPDDNYSKIISHEDSDMSSDDSLRPEKNDRNISREDLSCLDSLNPGNYPQNVPHFPFSFDGDASMNISTDFDKQGDEWSYDDNYPLAQTENELKSYRMNQSYMTDSDDSSTTLSITSADLDGSLLSYVENASTVQTEQEGRSIQSYVGTVDGNALKLAGEIRK